MARPCPCESGLSAERCCEAVAATLSPPAAAWRLRPLLAEAQKALAAGENEKARSLLIDLLELAPGEVEALFLLGRLHREAGRLKPAEALLRRVVRLNPNHIAGTQDLALVLFNAGKLHEAESAARFAIRLAPRHPQSHNLLGLVFTELNRPWLGAHHYREAQRLGGARDPILTANLAWALKNSGRIEEARALYEDCLRARPGELRSWIGYASLEEADRNPARSLEVLEEAIRATGASPFALRLSRATALERLGRNEEALAVLEEGTAEAPPGPLELSLKGRILDRLGRFEEAFAAFRAGKARALELGAQRYLRERAEDLARRLKQFFTADRLSLIPRPRAPLALDMPTPVFIVGFPRSGTTLIEQILASHPEIDGGDELPFISDLAENAARLLGSPLGYPEALSETWMADHRDDLELLRDQYLRAVRRAGLPRKRGVRFITDKMPLNETHLGLIGLLFPDAPIIHLIRHPLDVVLSVFSNHLTHGFHCAAELGTIAAHYRLVMDLVAHYRSQMTLRYLPVRYEDVIAHPEAEVRRLLDFIGLAFDEACLAFHENRRYARTASYAQVTEPLYDRSVYRHRHYEKELAPLRPALAEWIVRLGYEEAQTPPPPPLPTPFAETPAPVGPPLNPAEIEDLLQTAVREESRGAYERAREALDRVLAAVPDHPHAHHMRGIVAYRQKDFRRARHHMEISVALAPEAPLYPRNLCEVYRRLGLYEAARRAAERAVELAPHDVVALCNLGVVHLHRLETAEALAVAERALALAPEHPPARFLRGEALLMEGRYEEGFREYEWRMKLPESKPLLPNAPDKPLWDGTPLPGGRLLLVADQGFGDAIQFSRFIPWARSRAKEVVLAASRDIKPLFANWPELDAVYDEWGALPPFDAYAALASLPHLSGLTLETFPPFRPYITAEPERIARWEERLSRLIPTGFRRVGLVWAGQPRHVNDHVRSMPLETLAPLGELSDITFVSLQRGEGMSQVSRWLGRAPLISLGPELETFADTAAVLAGLDLLIAVDISVVHLAGAMGRPVWVLLPYAPDWRWGLKGETTPWYPSARLFRQDESRRWDRVTGRVKEALRSEGRWLMPSLFTEPVHSP